MTNALERRDFLLAATAAAALIARRSPAGAAERDEKPLALAGQLTRIAAIDDCLRLGVTAAELSADLQRILAEQHEVVRAGGLLPRGAERAAALLESGDDRKAALGLGWLLDDAVTKRLDASGEEAVREDVVTLREVFLAQPAADRQALEAARERQVEDAFQLMRPRTLTVLHTFTPDRDDIYAWIPKLAAWDRRVGALLEAYGKEYLVASEALDFYDRKDGLIETARRIQTGEAVSRSRFSAALDAAASGSRYARALAAGYRRLEAADGLLAGRLGRAQFESKLML